MQELGPNQELWLQALESGEYKQGFDALCRVYPDGTVEYCCLGVANELFSEEVIELVTEFSGSSIKGWGDEYDLATNDTVEILKLYDNSGRGRSVFKTLVQRNDNGESFIEIAASIRKDPSMYFKEPN